MMNMVELPKDYRLVTFEHLDSTNEETKRRAQGGADAGLVLWAQSQSVGRGRRGRTWISPDGGLYFSILLRPDCPPAQAAQLSFVSALAVCDGIADELSNSGDLKFKWPNDVLIEDRKIAGILLESANGAKNLEWLAVGIGINVASHPNNMDYPATSLNAESNSRPALENVLGSVIRAFDNWMRLWQSEGFVPIQAAWLERARGLHQEIVVRLSDQTIIGIFQGLALDGALRLEVPGEGERIIPAGDVYFPRHK